MREELDKLVIGRQDYNIIGYDGTPDYTLDDAPSYSPSTAGLIAKQRYRWVNVELIVMGVTEDTVIGQRQVLYEEYFISVREDSE